MSTIDCSVGGNDDTNWFLAPNPISAVIMEGTAEGALLFLLIGFIFTSGLIDQELRHFKSLKHRFLWIYPLFSALRLLGVFFPPDRLLFVGPAANSQRVNCAVHNVTDLQVSGTLTRSLVVIRTYQNALSHEVSHDPYQPTSGHHCS